MGNIPTDMEGRPFSRPAFILRTDEYAKIKSEIDSLYHALYKGKEICVHVSFGLDGNVYVYWFENHGYGDYNIFMRVLDNH